MPMRQPVKNTIGPARSTLVHRTHSKFNATLPSRSALVRPRPYPKHLTPNTSALRPPCAAHDRLRFWRPALSRIDACDKIPFISDDDLERILAVMNVAWAQGTRESYGSGLLVYHVFCDSRQIPEEDRCPASHINILLFISSCAGSYAGRTLANYVCGIRAWHILHGHEWTMGTDQVKAALDGATKLAPPSSRRPKREPFTVKLIESLLEKLDTSDPLDAAVAACLTTTFWTVARTGEFTVPSIGKFDPGLHVKRSDIHRDQDRNGLKVTVFFLPRTKCSDTGEDVYWGAQDGPADPAPLLENHLLVNDAPPTAHLFAYRHTKGLRPLTKKVFMDRLNDIALSIGLEPLKGHGIRIGGTLEYLLRGVPFDVVKSIGRWSGEAFLLYLRQHAVILAPYMQAHPLLETFTRYTMPPVR